MCDNYKLERIWRAVDKSGNEAIHTQILTIIDSTTPRYVETLPAPEINADCENIPLAEELTAIGTCKGRTIANYYEKRVEGDCSSRYMLVRTWKATNECGDQNIFK